MLTSADLERDAQKSIRIAIQLGGLDVDAIEQGKSATTIRDLQQSVN